MPSKDKLAATPIQKGSVKLVKYYHNSSAKPFLQLYSLDIKNLSHPKFDLVWKWRKSFDDITITIK